MTGPLRIEGEMTIYRAHELKDALLELIQRTQDPALDLSSVTEVDTAGVQLLLLARRAADDRHTALRITAVSAPVTEALKLLGLEASFGLQ